MNRIPVVNEAGRAAYGGAPTTDVEKKQPKAAPIYKKPKDEKSAAPKAPAAKPKAKK